MAHEDINFLGVDYTDNLQNVFYKVTESYLPDSLADPLRSFLATFDSSNSKRLPSTYDEFVAAFKAHLQNAGLGNIDEEVFLVSFVTYYRQALGIPLTPVQGGIPDITESIAGTDWNDLALQGVTAQDIVAQFKEEFGHFLRSYEYQTDGTVGPTGQQEATFLNQWFTEISRIANITWGLDADPSDGRIAAYEKIYQAYGFDQADFGERLKAYYDEVVQKEGFFIPGYGVSGWFEAMRNDYLKAIAASGVTLDPESAKRLLIIDRILRLMIDMIDVLNSVAASQANRLAGFLTNWQREYTNLMDQVPTFSGGDGTKLGEQTDNQKDFEAARNELNQKMASLLEGLRSKRSLVQDDAKALQSVINQTQDAANQQTNIATAILQQLSTILGAIFR
jgi:hypothetical protein